VDLGFLRRLYDQIGDYVSVYMDTDQVHEQNSAEAREIRWHDARRTLRTQGAGEATLDAVAEVLLDPGEVSAGRAIFARDGAVVFTGALDAPPRRAIARLAPLPHLMPLLAQHRPPIPHVRVSASRTGGELVAVGGNGDAWRDWMAGRQWPVHKVSVGGWSQDKYQRRAEDTWEENAKELAGEVIGAADRIGAQHVIVSGDVHARTMLVEHLTVPLRESAAVLDKEVSADSPAMVDAADQALTSWADSERRQRFEDWGTYLAHDKAVQALAQTLTALRNSQAADVFLADDPHSVATAWIGPSGPDVAVTGEELVDRGVIDPVQDRADAAIVRAIATTDAQLHFLPEDLVTIGDLGARGGFARPRDGIAATLRFPPLINV
jgi:Bacterial archaeo-eukaryotic release factor family 2